MSRTFRAARLGTGPLARTGTVRRSATAEAAGASYRRKGVNV